MPRSSNHPLTRCAHCQHGARFHRRDGGVVLLGRLMRWNGRLQWLCAVCLGNLSPRLRRAWLGKESA